MLEEFQSKSEVMAEHSGSEVDRHTKKSLWYWILVISMSPIAILLLIFMALGSLLQFFFKASLLFIIVAINTPFAIMCNVSIMMLDYYFRNSSTRLWKSGVHFWKSGACFLEPNIPHWNWSDPRASAGIEIQILVSDFLKTVAAELLLIVSAGIITFYTTPLRVFYISMAISLVAILHKWLNTDCLSKIALSCLCDGYGLNPTMFLYSFIGLFNIGCHPVAKCSFVASRAFLFIKDGPNVLFIEEDGHNPINNGGDGHMPPTTNSCMMPDQKYDGNPDEPSVLPEMVLCEETGQNPINNGGDGDQYPLVHLCMMPRYKKYDPNQIPRKACHYLFNGALPMSPVTTDAKTNGAARPTTTDPEVTLSIHFDKWNAFERGLFQLRARIDFIRRDNGKYILKSFMVLKLLEKFLCEYPVERLELHEDYSKVNELYHFLDTLSKNNGFATDKMRGRYERSLTLSEMAQEFELSVGYTIVKPMDKTFVVA